METIHARGIMRDPSRTLICATTSSTSSSSSPATTKTICQEGWTDPLCPEVAAEDEDEEDPGLVLRPRRSRRGSPHATPPLSPRSAISDHRERIGDHRREDPRRPRRLAPTSAEDRRDRRFARNRHRRRFLPGSAKAGILFLPLLILSCGSVDEALASASASASASPPSSSSSSSLPCPHLGEWAGQWYQSGISHPIRISASSLGHKGQCVAEDVRGRVMKKFLLHNQEENCYRCVVIHQRHRNVLQYKESPCRKTRSSLRSLCQGITGDSELYSLFRMNSSAMTCPVQGHFSFSYNRGHGWCGDPASAAKTCVGDSSLLFHYQACPDIPGTESFQEELQCIGEWKEGTTKYLVVKAVDGRLKTGAEKFKCLAYNIVTGSGVGSSGLGASLDDGGGGGGGIGTPSSSFSSSGFQPYSSVAAGGSSSWFRSSVGAGAVMGAAGVGGGGGGGGLLLAAGVGGASGGVLGGGLMDVVAVDVEISISDGATCNGLISASEGAQMLRLVREEAPSPRCTLPSWFLRHRRWHTLDKSVVYHVRPSNDTVDVVTSSRRRGSSRRRSTDDGGGDGDGDGTLFYQHHQELCHHLLPPSTVLRADDGETYVDVVSHVTRDCDSGYVCSRIWKRDGDVVEVVQGTPTEHPSDACSHMHEYPSAATSVILIPSELSHRPCPWRGMYRILLSQPNPQFSTNDGYEQNPRHEIRGQHQQQWSQQQQWQQQQQKRQQKQERRWSGNEQKSSPSSTSLSSGSTASAWSSPSSSSSAAADCAQQFNRRVLKMGCSELHAMEMEHSCDGTGSAAPTLLDKFVCHAAWEDRNTHRIVASRYSKNNSTLLDTKVCFVTTTDAFGTVETVYVGTTCFPLGGGDQHQQRRRRPSQPAGSRRGGFDVGGDGNYDDDDDDDDDGGDDGGDGGGNGYYYGQALQLHRRRTSFRSTPFDGGGLGGSRTPLLAAATAGGEGAYLQFDVTYGGDCSAASSAHSIRHFRSVTPVLESFALFYVFSWVGLVNVLSTPTSSALSSSLAAFTDGGL